MRDDDARRLIGELTARVMKLENAKSDDKISSMWLHTFVPKKLDAQEEMQRHVKLYHAEEIAERRKAIRPEDV